MSRPRLIVRVQVAPHRGEPHGAAVAGAAGAFLFNGLYRLPLVLGRLRTKPRQQSTPSRPTGLASGSATPHGGRTRALMTGGGGAKRAEAALAVTLGIEEKGAAPLDATP
jgi:hypothetical protein